MFKNTVFCDKREKERLRQQAEQEAEDLIVDRLSHKRQLRDKDPLAQGPVKYQARNVTTSEEAPPPPPAELTSVGDDKNHQYRCAAFNSPLKPDWCTFRHSLWWITSVEIDCSETHKKQYEVVACAHNTMHPSWWKKLFPMIDEADFKWVTEPKQYKDISEILDYRHAHGHKIVEHGLRPYECHDILQDDDRDFDDQLVWAAVYDPPQKLLNRHNEIHVPYQATKKQPAAS